MYDACMRHGFGLEWPGLIAARRPIFAAIVLVALTLLSLATLPFLRFDDNSRDVFASDDATALAYQELFDQMNGATAEYLILATSTTAFDEKQLSDLSDLSLEVGLVDGVQTVLSPTIARFPPAHDQFANEPVYLSRLSYDEQIQRFKQFARAPQLIKPMISEDLSVALILVTLDQRTAGLTTREVLGELANVTSAYSSSGIEYQLAGEGAASLEAIDAIKIELVVLNLVGAVLAFAAALFIFKDFRTAFLTVAPAGFGMLFSLAIFTALGLPMTVISNIVPILVLVLGMADSVHLALHFRRADEKIPMTQRIENAVREVGPACALTALTTALAFCFILTSNNQQLVEFAILGATGVVAAYFAVIVAFPILARLTTRETSPAFVPKVWLNVPSFVSNWTKSVPRLIIVVSAVITLAGALGYANAKPWFPLYKSLPSQGDVRKASEIVSDNFGGFFRLWIEFDNKGDFDLNTSEGWQNISEFTGKLKQQAPDYTVISLPTLAEWFGDRSIMPSQDQLALLGDEFSTLLLSSDGSKTRILALTPEPMQSDQTLATLDRVEKFALNAGASNVIGTPIIIRHESLALITQLNSGLVGACLAAVLLVGFAFRRLALSVVLLLPNVLPLLVTGSALHILNGGYMTPSAVLALTVAFGIAIDDSIHFLSRYRIARQLGADVDEAIRKATNEAGHVMIVTTILLAVGLSSTMFSGFETVKLFGQMLVLTFVTALLADLILLPALLRLKMFENLFLEKQIKVSVEASNSGGDRAG